MVELLDLESKVALVAAQEIKWVCYVRDFNSGEVNNPERLLRKTFAGRPRIEGVHLRLKLTDGDVIEGVAANDRSLLGAEGVFLLPPDTRSNTQRMWIPVTAIAELEAMAVVGSAKKKMVSARVDGAAAAADQPELFE
ncbi:hypothetical protein ACP_0514 [Acidobacterium capsulatum ATCC 51196]|uniref:Uncharacterized protein n=2 Tax=Acidobacteriaceae TaxID=204434 RepID=C1F114_ACIC5|nr:hypothetical protein ACP_0514 [Acidobacterium capsulatum ATCC 51196]